MSDAEMNLQGVDDVFALNASQQGMLYHSEAAPGTGVYVGVLSCTLPDDLHLETFKAAWARTVARHDSLRSLFVWHGVDDPLQVVRSECDIPWEMIDTPLPEADGAADPEYVERIRQEGIELSTAPAMRFILGRLPSGARSFLWVCHHALIDDWSQALVLEEVQATYRGLREGADMSDAPGLAISAFADWIASRDEEQDEAFWSGHFAGFSSPTRLQLDRRSAAEGATMRKASERKLDVEASDALRQAAKEQRVTFAAVATGVWAVVLQRLTGEADLAFGIAATQRPPELDQIDRAVGNFVTTMPVRARIDDHATLGGLIQACHETVQDTLPRSGIALTRLKEILGLRQDGPMFDSILSIKQDALTILEDDGPTLFNAPDIHFKSDFPLAVVVLPGQRVGLRVIYDPHTYSEESAQQVLELFEQALRAAPRWMDASPTDLPVMSQVEEQRARNGLCAQTGLPAFDGVLAAFRRHAEETPDAPAIVSGSQCLSYADVLERAATLAGHMTNDGLGSGDRVGLYLHRSCDVPVAMLACLMAGIAYVPFDAAFPQTRLKRMIDAAKLSAIVTRRDHFAHLAGASDRFVDLDDLQSRPNPDVQLPDMAGEDVAYVMFTSGSTGVPKGVMVTRSNLDASTAARIAWYPEPPSRYLVLSSHAFDSSVAGIFWTLCTGGTLYLADQDTSQRVAAIADIVSEQGITHVLCLPSVCQLLFDGAADRLTSLHTMIVAGEEASGELLRTHASKGIGARLINEYGPTEATVWCAVADLTGASPEARVPIGRPIPGATLYVCDARGRAVPPGLPGELIVGGPGIAAGYFDLHADTEHRFIPDPHVPGQRLYRTGDLVRQRADDGQLVYLGRVDAQVKFRGYRIELSEIEAVLAFRPDVREAAVAAQTTTGNASRLVAYIVAREKASLSPDALATFCREALPDFMVPTHFVSLTALPRLPNGKVDRSALPELQIDQTPAASVLPSTPAEAVLAELWRKTLWLDRSIGVDERFSDLGGHSLLAMRLVNEIEQTFELRIPLSALGRMTTVSDQATLIEQIRRDGGAALVPPAPQTGIVPDVLAGLDAEEDRKLRTLLSTWKASPAREGSKIRVLNESGTLPPLFFCFLDEYSFAQMAEHLGSDQPLYGIRGVNSVVPMTGEDQFEDNMRRAAISYLADVIDLAGGDPILLGGYCQGATIALHLAAFLTALGHPVATTLLLEKTPPITYPGHVDILFADKSFLNPYREFDKPEAAWERRYGSHTFRFFSGDYLNVFAPPHVTDLVIAVRECLEAALDAPPVRLPRKALVLSWGEATLPTCIRPSQEIHLDVPLRNESPIVWHPTATSGLRLRADWVPLSEQAEPRRPTYIALTERVGPDEEQTFRMRLRAPDSAGAYRLEIDMIEEGHVRFCRMGNAKLCLLSNIADAAEDDPLLRPGGAEADAGGAALEHLDISNGCPEGTTDLDRPAETSRFAALSALRDLGAQNLRARNLSTAERDLKSALSIDPSDAGSLLTLGRVRIEQGRLLSAYRLLRRAGSRDADAILATLLTPRGTAQTLKRAFKERLAERNGSAGNRTGRPQ